MAESKNYFRVMLGAQSMHAQQCYDEEWIGVEGIDTDLSDYLMYDWNKFNRQFKPIYLEAHPEKSEVAAGLTCGMLHRICTYIKQDDIVLCPDGKGNYWTGKVVSNYFYRAGEILPHRRRVEWLPESIARSDMSEYLKRSTSSSGTVIDLLDYVEELEGLIKGNISEPMQYPATFTLERHLEDFLVENWTGTALGKDYDIFTDEGKPIGQQYQTGTGIIDILAIRKDQSEFLVVELKKGRASDAVVGQILRYIGDVHEELAEPNQKVRGCIIALENDQRLRRALQTIPHVDFFKYRIEFELEQEEI